MIQPLVIHLCFLQHYMFVLLHLQFFLVRSGLSHTQAVALSTPEGRTVG